MNAFNVKQTVGEIVAQNPDLARVCEEMGIDYCCGGQKTIEQASRDKGLDPRRVLQVLNESDAAGATQSPLVDAAAMSLTELANHIEQTHHAYLRHELPRLVSMLEKVADVHGARDPRLLQVLDTFPAMANELYSHMVKEEQCLFSMVRQLEASDQPPLFHCGSLANPIRQMEWEHDQAGSALEQLRELTDDFVPPEWACNSYRVVLDALSHLERDMHMHIHKENNILFPRALEMEAQKWQKAADGAGAAVIPARGRPVLP